MCAEEKFKPNKKGTAHHYIYYGCSRFNDKFCKNTYLREEGLVLQLIEIVDKIDINQVGMKNRLEKEIEKYSSFRSKVLGLTDEERLFQTRFDLRAYMKHVLERGTTDEKRELMQSFTSKIISLLSNAQ